MGAKKQRIARCNAHDIGADPTCTTHFVQRRDGRKVTQAEVDRCLRVGKRSMLANYNFRYHDEATGVVVITDAHRRVTLTTWRCDVGDHGDDYGFKHVFPSKPSPADKDPSVQRHMNQWASSIRRLCA